MNASNRFLFHWLQVHLGDRLMEESARIQVTFEVFLMEKSYFCHKDGFDIVDRTGEVRAYEKYFCRNLVFFYTDF